MSDQDQDLESARRFARGLLIVLLGAATAFVLVGAACSMMMH
jgi:hypothetical protein